MLDILEDITQGAGKPEDVELLDDLARGIKQGSLCGLGQTAPNPVLTTLRYFEKEYVAHISNETCPAKVCKAFIEYHINEKKCTGCRSCARACPVEAITGEAKKVHVIDVGKCIKCGLCYDSCPSKFSAVEIITGKKRAEVASGK
jgi:ferredoxin